MGDPTERMTRSLTMSAHPAAPGWHCLVCGSTDILVPFETPGYLVVVSGRIVDQILDATRLPVTGVGWCMDCERERSFAAR